MKKFKKLIPALCMLLISAVLMGTSTYAWFSMNKSVKAEGMQVTAQSNSTYLLIATGDANKTAEAIQALTTNTTATVTGNQTLYPAAFNNSTSALEVDDASKDTEAGNDGKTSIAAHKWYTANSTSSSNATTRTTNVKQIDDTASEEFQKYVRTDVFYLALTKDSEAYANKTLKVDFAKGAGDDAAIATVVEINGVYFILDAATATYTFTGITIPNTGNALVVNVYTFINGTSTNVNSDYINGGKTIAGIVTLTFSIA